MCNWILKLEEAVGRNNMNDLAVDVVQGVALTCIGILLLGWFVMLL